MQRAAKSHSHFDCAPITADDHANDLDHGSGELRFSFPFLMLRLTGSPVTFGRGTCSRSITQHLLGEDGGRQHMGVEGERKLGHRYYSELPSVITSQPLFQVRYGRLEVGFVHPMSFVARADSPTILALGGRGWRLQHVDWKRKIAHVEPAQETGRSRWIGSSVPLSFSLCQAVLRVLESGESLPSWSRRASERIRELRQELSPCCGDGTVIVRREQTLEWWTFAGLAVNQTIVQFLQPYFQVQLRADNFWINLPTDVEQEELVRAIKEAGANHALPQWDLRGPATDLLKFGDLLPDSLLRELILARIADVPRARQILEASFRITRT